jgi:hypothetical protein
VLAANTGNVLEAAVLEADRLRLNTVAAQLQTLLAADNIASLQFPEAALQAERSVEASLRVRHFAFNICHVR